MGDEHPLPGHEPAGRPGALVRRPSLKDAGVIDLAGTVFSPPNKVIRIHELPPRAPGQPAMDNSFLSFLSGMDASEAKRRYELKLVDNPADKWWHYLSVKPRLAADQAEFQEARVVLHSQAQPAFALLPKQMTLIQPNGNDTWRFGYQLDLTFSDGSVAHTSQAAVQLTQDSRTLTQPLAF